MPSCKPSTVNPAWTKMMFLLVFMSNSIVGQNTDLLCHLCMLYCDDKFKYTVKYIVFNQDDDVLRSCLELPNNHANPSGFSFRDRKSVV